MRQKEYTYSHGRTFLRLVFVFIFLSSTFGVTPARSAQALGVEQAPKASELTVPLMAPVATVALGMPTGVLLRDDVTFSVTFENTGDAPGFGPFIDLVIPATAGLGANSISVSYAGTTIVPSVRTFALSGLNPVVTHPYARDSSGNLITVNATTIDASIVAGDKFVSILLPFGSFSPGQPCHHCGCYCGYDSTSSSGRYAYLCLGARRVSLWCQCA